MNAWASFWGWLFAVSIAFFAILTIVVAIGGAADIRAMFRTIAEQNARHSDDDRSDQS